MIMSGLKDFEKAVKEKLNAIDFEASIAVMAGVATQEQLEAHKKNREYREMCDAAIEQAREGNDKDIIEIAEKYWNLNLDSNTGIKSQIASQE